jgi:hypothetical protein
MKFIQRLLLLAMPAAAAMTVIDFESATVLLAPNDKANRAPKIEEKGVVFQLAAEPRTTKAKGLVMYFEHLSTGHKGIGSAMALEPIPVRATFPKPITEATISFWGSAGAPAVLEAFDEQGNLAARATLEAIPARKSPADPEPFFTLSVRANRIAYIQFSGPRPGEFLAADHLHFTPKTEEAPH